MIPEKFRHRFEGDSGVDIAAHEIDARFPDGETRRVVLRLGQPFLRGEDYLIRAEIENLDRTDGPLTSCSSLDAVLMGLEFIAARLDVFSRRHGARYYWPDSECIFDIKSYFSLWKPGASDSQADGVAPIVINPSPETPPSRQ